MLKIFRYDDVPVVKTNAGLLKGYAYDDMYIFKGIPYATAKRFQMPQPVEPWEGVKDACSYGFVCPMLSQDTPSAEVMVPHRYWPMDENCQSLNIWTESLDANAKKPVIVWLHGGGYSMGSSIEQVAYDGFNAARTGDMVVVSINHRLNILGYFDMSPFGEKYANSANAGHADMVAALQWVHDNIEQFGGDPENVTIFGQSGGGMKVADLMQIPAADGLFQKGLIMSGVSDGTLLPPAKGDGRAIVAAMLAELGFGEDEAEKLETIPYRDLADAYNKVFMSVAMQGGYVGNGPMKNDYYYGEPLIYGFREHAYEIPVMVGSVFGEFAFEPLPIDKTTVGKAEITAMAQAQLGERAGELVEKFAEVYPNKHISDVMSVDTIFRGPSKAIAKAHAAGGKAPAYLYNFTFNFPLWQNKPAWHCSDIPFFFHNTDLVEYCGIPGVADKLEEQIFGAFANFAKCGNPNHDTIPTWAPVTEEDEPTMIFDRECEVRHNYDDELLALCKEILPPINIMEMMAANVQH